MGILPTKSSVKFQPPPNRLLCRGGVELFGITFVVLTLWTSKMFWEDNSILQREKKFFLKKKTKMTEKINFEISKPCQKRQI